MKQRDVLYERDIAKWATRELVKLTSVVDSEGRSLGSRLEMIFLRVGGMPTEDFIRPMGWRLM